MDLSERRMKAAESVQSLLAASLSSAEMEIRPDGELVVRVPAGDMPAAARILAAAKPLPLNYLSCVTGVDWPEQGKVEVIYSLYSMPDPAAKVSLRTMADREVGKGSIPSLVSVWPTADYQEREIFDMYGLKFEGHPDLRRILLDESFEGHPLRKDFVDNRPPHRRVTREDYQP